MSNLWENGGLVETVDMYNVYIKCPKCGGMDAKMWNENRFAGRHDGPRVPMEEATVTYKNITHYKCKSCNHRWMI
jgi:DNA-directed RNA polymerase subunit RPC12/RpoP